MKAANELWDSCCSNMSRNHSQKRMTSNRSKRVDESYFQQFNKTMDAVEKVI